MDSNAFEWLSSGLAKSGFYTTKEVLNEIDRWHESEKEKDKFGQYEKRHRPGFAYAMRNLEGSELEEFLTENEEGFNRFRNALDICNHFHSTPCKVLDLKTGEFYQQFEPLLTKTLVYDVARSDPALVNEYSSDRLVLNRLTDLAMVRYKAAIISIYGHIPEEISQKMEGKKERVEHRLRQICQEVSNRQGRSVKDTIERFENGVKADLNLVSTAYSLLEEGYPVNLYSNDLDLMELVEYVNIKKGINESWKKVIVKTQEDLKGKSTPKRTVSLAASNIPSHCFFRLLPKAR